MSEQQQQPQAQQPQAQQQQNYNSRSLDRRRHKSSRRSRKENQPTIIRRSGSQEEVYTGTLVTEIPENFLVHMEPRKESEQMTDIDPNSKGSSDSLLVEGKVELSENMRRRISRKGGRPGSKKNNSSLKHDATDGSESVDAGKSESTSKPVIKCENENGYIVSSQNLENGTTELTIPVPSVKNEQVSTTKEVEEEGDETVLRNSTASTDSGIAEPSERELASHGTSTENSPTEMSVRTHLLPPRNFEMLRFRNKDRDSMLLSQLCVVAVTLPADIHQGQQKGKGAILKFRFSPYTQIEALRVAILKQFNERFEVTVEKLSKLHLFRYLEEEEGWEYLEEDRSLQDYNLHNESKLELKCLSSTYRDMRVVIPQLECSLSVEFDQFSTVGDVLRQVLDLSQPQLDPTEGYTLYHVRLRMTLDPTESMVFYHILSSDVLECRLAVGKLHEHSVILTIKIPSIQSSRKVKVCLDETVGELMSTLMRRVPDPESSRWAHMALYLRPKNSSVAGVWMEDYKFLAAYKLKATDVIEFRPKYRPMKFELKVYPHDHEGDNNVVYATPELLIAQDSFVSDVIDLLCNSCSLEYDPRLYGLYLHDDQQLPQELSMWDYLDDSVPGYQDSIVLHMVHKPITVSFEGEEQSTTTLNVDFSQPCKVLRNILCRRYGCRYHCQYGLVYEGIILHLHKSLHNQGVCEQEKIALMKIDVEEVREGPPASPVKMQLLRKDSQSCLMERDAASRESLALVEDDCNIWDEDDSGEVNIRFDKKRPGVVVGASFNKLVERITSVTDHDLEFVKTFLLTYQSFATPDKLLRKLIERYNVVRPTHMAVSDFAHMRQTIQARVINALRLWVEYGVDFKDNVTLQNNILHFISTVLVLDHARLCRPLRTNILSIRGVIQKKNVKMFRDPAPPVKFPVTSSPILSVFDFDPEEIARQLTIIDFSLFAKIKPAELLNQAWQKPKYRHRAHNILRLVERMNNLTLWVATTILSQRDVTNRARRIASFIQISSHLHQMHNYCTLLSVLNGLAHHSITRLKKSFARLDKTTRSRLEELETLARPGDHFRMLREELKKASNPCIPYLGLYMSDLTFLDNGNPNFHSDSLINFSKCRLIYHQIRDLILRQDKPYNFEEVPALHESLMKFNFLDSDTLYDVALTREPKDKEKK